MVYLYERKETLKAYMKNILAENLLRFGVRNLSESDRKTLMEAASAAGSYKSRVGDMIATMTFTIKDSTLMLTSNGALVCQWTINPDPKKDTDRNISAFIPKKGTALPKLFNDQGQMVVDPSFSDSGAYGFDKSMLTALTETLNAQPANSPWKVLRKSTNMTYSQSMLSRFTTWTSKLSDNGIRKYIVVMSLLKFTGADRKAYTINTTVYYQINEATYKVEFSSAPGIKLPASGGAASSLQDAIQEAIIKVAKVNQTIINPGVQTTLSADLMKNVFPKMDALVKQL